MASENDSDSVTESRTIEQPPLPAGTMDTTEVNAITENAPISPHELDRIETPGDAQPVAEEHNSDNRNSACSTSDEDGMEANRETGIKGLEDEKTPEDPHPADTGLEQDAGILNEPETGVEQPVTGEKDEETSQRKDSKGNLPTGFDPADLTRQDAWGFKLRRRLREKTLAFPRARYERAENETDHPTRVKQSFPG